MIRDVRPREYIRFTRISRQGFVWRTARPSDLVCVTPDTRARTAEENRTRKSHWTIGAYGPHTCVSGQRWREAFNGDDVCVTPEVRSQTLADNAQAAGRRVSAKLWITTYRTQGNVSRLQLNGNHYNFGQVRLYLRYNGGGQYWSGTATAVAQPGHAGGAWGKKTGKPQCPASSTPNGYAQAYDVVSGRWSARVPVQIGCVTFD
ncbi:hypothetical protein [Nonomuraea sp. NPDC046570]|uniref:hypothetical protein n=1 Tax=Nonomuraea sp. NPDC046570 TaxID=3155255 RepID=UPI0033C591A1